MIRNLKLESCVVIKPEVSKVAYVEDEAVVELIFAPDVVPEIIRLEANFTSYELEQVAGSSC